MKAVQYVASQIRYMCSTFGSRTGGSASERRCQEHIRQELSGYADTITMQRFTVHPDAGWGWIVVVALCGLAAILVPLLNMQSVCFAAAGMLAAALAAAVTLFQFLMGREMIDRFFPKREAVNVFASSLPSGPVKRRLVFCGHADAACEMTYSHLGGARLVLRVAITSMIALVLVLVLNSVLFVRHLAVGAVRAGSVWYWLRLFLLLLVPCFLEALFFFNPRRIVDGANDNLSGCAVAMATLKAFSGVQSRPKHTELCCLITSSEECGLRGAKAFAKQFARSQESDVETVFIVLDTLRDVQQLQVYTRGMNGFVENSAKAARLIQQSAAAIGLNLPESGSYLGATDAEALSREGLEACAVCAVDHTPQPYYHTRADTADNIDEHCLAVCVNLCAEIVCRFDAQEDAFDAAAREAV